MNPEARATFVPLAIVGMGALFPKAGKTGAYWANIVQGKDCITEVPATHWRPEDYFNTDPKAPDLTYSRRGGFLEPVAFNPLEFGISPNNLEATDTSQLLGMYAAAQALRDAGYDPADQTWDRSRTSVILGVTGTLELVIPLGARLGHPLWRKALREAGVPDEQAGEVVQRIADGYVPWQENSFPGLLGNVVAGRIANRFDLGGTNCVVDAACASSLSALHLAALELAAGRSDMVVTGGADTFNDIFMYMCFSKTPALSPTGDARPFDAQGDGTILGEGVGILVVKRLTDAVKDGNRIYAVIRGLGSSSDGRGNAIYAPKGEGQMRALQAAYELAEVAPQTIELIEGHGTGTKVGDATELGALTRVFGAAGKDGRPQPEAADAPQASWCAVGSVKSQIGHTKAAAGAAGLIKAALALHHKVLPPSIKAGKPLDGALPGKSPFYLNPEKRPWVPRGNHPRRAGVSSFGFGGTNFHCVLEEYAPAAAPVAWDGEVQVLAWSATAPAQLQEQLSKLNASLPWPGLRELAARTRKTFDPAAAYRLTLVAVNGRTNFAQQLEQARGLLDRAQPAGFAQAPEGVYLGSGAAGDVAVLFPGQGSQYPNMLRDLACQFPVLVETLGEAEQAFAARHPGADRLSESVYPLPAYDAGGKERDERRLRDTRVAQPALGTAALGAWKLLERFGLHAAAFAGHSFGELVALHAAGVIGAEALHELACVRGQLMAEAGGGDRGAMLAVQAPLEAVELALAGEKIEAVLANKNAPQQWVLSGATAEIEKAAAACARRNLRATRLPVAAAFHSPLVAAAEAPFRAVLDRIDFRAPKTPVYANLDAKPYPADGLEARAKLAAQLSNPVEFIATVRNLHAAGVRTFVEAGPGSRLTGLVRAILGDAEHAAVALDASNGKGDGQADLARSLAVLAARGQGLRLELWDEGFVAEPAVAPGLAVPICGANFRKPRESAPARKSVAAPMPTMASIPAPVANTTPAPGAPREVAPLLRATQENMKVMMALQEQTARLHQQFLNSQADAQRSLQMLLEQQRRIFAGEAPRPISLPQPVPPAPAMASIAQPLPSPATIQATATAPAPATASAARELETALLEIVAEKTGYPASSIQLTMDLEADLGIDSIKRVEILSALQERFPQARAFQSDELGALRTLEQIVKLAGNGMPAAAKPAPVAAPVAVQTAAQAPTTDQHALAAVLLEIVAEKTGYPASSIQLTMDLEADLGIDSIKRVEILSALQERFPQARAFQSDELGALRTLEQIVKLAGNGTPAAVTTKTAPVQAVAPTSAAASAPAASGTAFDGNALAAALLEIVAEKTGYPASSIQLTMDLEADLGIDSIKRVEILSALQERFPQARAFQSDELGALRTLEQIVAKAGATAAPKPEPAPVAAPAPITPLELLETKVTPRAPEAEPVRTVERLVLSKIPLNGHPPSAAAPLPAGARVWVNDDDPKLAAALIDRLRDLDLTAKLISLHGLQGTTIPEDLAGLVLLAPRLPNGGAGDVFLKNAFRMLRLAGPALRRCGTRGGAALLTVARLDGGFGLGELGAHALPESGGLTGLAKTARHEWSEVRVKALDLAPDFADAATAAELIANELLTTGPVEVGLSPAGRWTLELVPAPFGTHDPERPVRAGDVVVISGGARGVTAEVSLALARSFQPVLVLLGRSPLPGAEPDWLRGIESEAAVKQALAGRMNGSATPKAIEAEYRRIAADREIRYNLRRIEVAGASAEYRSVDVRDAAAVRRTLDGIRKEFGPVRGLIHAAGVLADRLIEEKTDEQFDAVYGTKVEGLRNLLAALPADDLRLLVLFSSTTGRYGRKGQADYAAANEVLNKLAQAEARRRPACRCVAVNWGPWEGGMVTPGLRKLFEKEGVALIGLQAGAEYLVREICSNGERPVEVAVLAGGSRLPTVAPDTVSAAPAETAGASRLSSGRLPAAAAPDASLHLAFERNLDLERHPFLNDHVIDGRAVLPMSMAAEWLAQGALHQHPGLQFHGFNGLRIMKGIILGGSAGAPYRLRVLAGGATADGEQLNVPVEIWGAAGGGSERLHARGEAVLAPRLPEGQRLFGDPPTRPYEHSVETVYGEFLFHGPSLRGIQRVEGWSEVGIVATVRNAPPPAEWMKDPLRGSWITDPLALDCAFQLMILWSLEQHDAGSLPNYVKRYRQFRRVFPKDGTRVVVHISKDRSHMAGAEIEFLDHDGRLIARMEGHESTIDSSLRQAFRKNLLGA